MYKCECGKEFNNSQSFNGHKSGCKIHQLQKYGSLDTFYTKRHEKGIKAAQTRSNQLKIKKEQELQQWISEQHICENCGKIMTEKFGSGRFCSQACANSRKHSKETKEKIKKSVEDFNKNSSISNTRIYLKKERPKCLICGKKLFLKNKTGFCRECLVNSNEGQNKLSEISKNAGLGGYRKGSGIGKHGWYKGYYCDSSWELAYVIYNLDHNIEFKRNKQSFEYTFEGNTYKYFPDFIEGDTYIEIKGYYSLKWQSKLDQFPYQLKVLDKEGIEKYLDYTISKYGKNYIKLYE